jgi:hypothetical protein
MTAALFGVGAQALGVRVWDWHLEPKPKSGEMGAALLALKACEGSKSRLSYALKL